MSIGGAAEAPRLIGPPDHVLELEPLSYQYPDLAGRSRPGKPDWDANWLVVRLLASDGERSWTTADPAFTTWELQELVQWLRYAANDDSGAQAQYVATEPCLQFELRSSLASSPQLRVVFELEFSPPTGDPWIDFSPGGDGLRRFADQLEAALAIFPVR